ncbi:translation repressor [Acinetobacter phage 133]|uniref:Translation repressor protein n=1 Tax=Acinetobacter phage 133 TaxID=2919552 RepID=Q6J2P8_9CAUD|nr:translation repressor [Acinetobacter phage 133]AAT38485.1 RegA translational repressor protein [Acinetobacter phage 133]
MIEITPHQGAFLQIKETLTRMGIANSRDKVLYQSCHILQKQGRYYIAHFKDLLKLDGKPTDITEEDKVRTLSIATMLESWDLCQIETQTDLVPTNNFRIIKHSQKAEWKLVPKYTIGK